MASAARDRLGKALRGDAEPAPSTDLTVRMDALALDVEGFGRARFPVTPAKARKLVTLGNPRASAAGRTPSPTPRYATPGKSRLAWSAPPGIPASCPTSSTP